MCIDDKIKQADVEGNKEKIEGLLLSTRRDAMGKLVDWLKSTDFYTAPASSMPGRHGCYEGGLAEHSLHVYEAFRKKVEDYGLTIGKEEVVISSICHDFCKIDVYKKNVLKKGKVSDSKPYVMEEKFPIGHGEKSVVLVDNFIPLTEKEMLLIRWHMGMYDKEFENYSEKVDRVCPEIYAFHNADMEAARYMDGRKR